ncbi:MAG: type IV pilus modification PilV family protein [Coraliomargarita sp.]
MKNFHSKTGFSLTEVMIAVFVFSIVALGVASTTMLTSRIAISNIYRSTANSVAQGYAEQIKSISFDSVFLAFQDPTNYDIPTMSLSLQASDGDGNIQTEDPLIFGVPNRKNVLIDVEVDDEGLETPKTMPMWFTVVGVDLTAETNCWDAMEIRLDYEWEVGGENHRDFIQIVKTKVSEY